MYFECVNLHEKLERGRMTKRRAEAEHARQCLRLALGRVQGLNKAVVFGSLVRADAFHSRSDIDVAIEQEPPGQTCYQLAALLEEELGRPVDVVLLGETRLRDKIIREGELWML